MKIYVAGKFEKKEMIVRAYEELEAMGHEISYDWTVHKSVRPYDQNADLARQYARNEADAIADSDVFVYISDPRGNTLKMEVGAAILSYQLQGKPVVYAVGEYNSQSPWLFLDAVKRVDAFDDVLKDLE